MDTTFISIHDLSLDARLLYVSNSIGDILGYHPEEVVGRSCWEYFHPDEIPFAKSIHGRGVELDKAAVLNYCQIKAKDGSWIGCECCFTIVHDVLVGCTSIYRADPKSQQRAQNAPIIRQLFSSSPKDPRYHMLSYISTKFSSGPKPHIREPRAALFLNRFTRSLSIMYATNGLEALLGISSAELNGKSFYYCIQENCLPEAVRCLERAKANDSIAYLRFWYRDPRMDGGDSDSDESMSDAESSDQDIDDGGVPLHQVVTNSTAATSSNNSVNGSVSSRSSRNGASGVPLAHNTSNVSSDTVLTSSSHSTGRSVSDGVFDPAQGQTHTSSMSSIEPLSSSREQPPARATPPAVELEAVVSCTSDGLVVILRGARPFVPSSVRAAPRVAEPHYANGLFASPWATEPVMPQPQASHSPMSVDPVEAMAEGQWAGPGVPSQEHFMRTIRDAAVFAWALTGINGSLAHYSRGAPTAGAQPYGGLPVWQPVDGERRQPGYRNY